MFLPLLVTLSQMLTATRERLTARLSQAESEAGFTTLEWAVIGSIAFAMAVGIGAGLKAVAETYLGKIG